jgi:hypothetical protein
MLGSYALWNVKTRYVSGEKSLTPSNSAYIESHRADGHNYGCSFIEFDGKGSFLGYDQFENSLKVLDTQKARSDVLLVIYCHGWMNNAQSEDVLHFVSVVRRLADSSSIRSQNQTGNARDAARLVHPTPVKTLPHITMQNKP